MPGTAATLALIGSPAIANYGGFDTTAKVPVGTIVNVQDPVYGGQELIYLKMPVSQAARVGAVLAYDVVASYTASLVANTTLLGKPVAFLKNALTSLATAQFGWGVIAGSCPVWCDANIAANTGLGIVAAGQGGAIAAGKSILNARVTLPSTTAFVKANTQAVNASKFLQVLNSDNLFVGQAVTGTNMGAAVNLITAINADGVSIAVSVDSTATGASSVTFTNADATHFFNTVTCNRPMMQGPIT